MGRLMGSKRSSRSSLKTKVPQTGVPLSIGGIKMGKLLELLNELPPEYTEEGTTGRDLIDAVVYEAKKEGAEVGIRLYAKWKNGKQVVGVMETPLEEALSDLERFLL